MVSVSLFLCRWICREKYGWWYYLHAWGNQVYQFAEYMSFEIQNFSDFVRRLYPLHEIRWSGTGGICSNFSTGELFAVTLSIVDSVPNSAHGHINLWKLSVLPPKQNKGLGPCPRVRIQRERERAVHEEAANLQQQLSRRNTCRWPIMVCLVYSSARPRKILNLLKKFGHHLVRVQTLAMS